MSDNRRTALVTGATGGLGPSVVDVFLAAGWRVVAPARDATSRLPDRQRLDPVNADLTDREQVVRAVEAAAADPHAPLRAVVNLVGGFAADQPVASAPYADFEAMLEINLKPTYLVTQAALGPLAGAGGGAIVCVSSRAALRPFAGAAGYVAAKAALLAFVQVVALEGRPRNVRCNAVVPGQIDTPAERAANPHGKLTPPGDIARMIRLLCEDDAAVATGAAIPVDR